MPRDNKDTREHCPHQYHRGAAPIEGPKRRDMGANLAKKTAYDVRGEQVVDATCAPATGTIKWQGRPLAVRMLMLMLMLILIRILILILILIIILIPILILILILISILTLILF